MRQCGSAAGCTAVQKCAAGRAAVCGIARNSLCLFVFNNHLRLNLSCVRFE
jgi:hypothetical protein